MKRNEIRSWDDIPQYTRDAAYRVDVPLDSVESTLARYRKSAEDGLQLEPDFQRAHVWSTQKRRAYVEHLLRGGHASREIRFNCPGWMRDFRGPMTLVDGLQRLTAVRMFANSRLPVFGRYFHQFEGRFPWARCSLLFYINTLATRAEVLQWYLDLNAGGVVHTKAELDRVRELLERETAA